MTIASLRPKLTEDDIHRLVRGETAEARANVAHKLCRRIAVDALSADEKAYADEVISILVDDAAELVRRTLAIALRNSPRLPRSAARKLAEDVESVALPILECSPVFTDDDLIEIALIATVAKQVAIASRPKVSESVAEVMARNCAQDAVRTLAGNEGADLSEMTLEVSLSRFTDDEELTRRLVMREHLPVTIAEKLVSAVSGEVFDMLVGRHELPAQLAIELATNARDRAVIDLVEQAGRTQDLSRFVNQLNLNERLTPSLITRALCMGHMEFVEFALSELSGVAHARVWLMVHDAGPLGLQTVFDRAGLPRRLLPVFKAAIEVFHETELEGEDSDRHAFKSRMIERVLTQFQAIPREDLDYLLEKLDIYGDLADAGHGRETDEAQASASGVTA